MKHAELMKFVGKNVYVLFFDGEWECGKLNYVDEFSAKRDYRKPKYFYINHTSFKVSHIKKVKEIPKSCDDCDYFESYQESIGYCGGISNSQIPCDCPFGKKVLSKQIDYEHETRNILDDVKTTPKFTPNEIYLIVENLNPIAYCTIEEEAKKYCDNMNDEREIYRYIEIPCADGKVDLMKEVYYCHVAIFSKRKEDDWKKFFCELKTPMAIYTKDISPKVITDFNDLYKYDIHLPLPSDTKDYIYVIFYTKSRIPMDEEKNMAVEIFKKEINKC